MNTRLPILGISFLALSSLALAQDGAPPKPAPRPGAPAAAAAPAPTQEDVRLHVLANLIGLEIATQDKKVLGKVDDLILDSVDGSVDYVVIAQGGVLGIGEDRYLVPFESVLFGRPNASKDDELRVTTSLTEAHVRKAPKQGKEPRIGPDVERAIREAAGLSPVPMKIRAQNSELISARHVQGAEVLGATQEKIGIFDEVVLDPRAGVVAYTVLGGGGIAGAGAKRVALPWEVTHLRADSAEKLVFQSLLTKEMLAKAPEYDPKDPKRMTTSTFVRGVFASFSLEPYFSRANPAADPKAPSGDEKRKDGK